MPRALIFDFDGVLADTEPLHLAAFQRALAPVGIELTTDEYYATYLGYDDHDAIVAALGAAGQMPEAARVETLMAEKAEHFLALVNQGVGLFAGAEVLVRTVATHVPVAIGSGALRGEIELILERAGLRGCFVAIVSAEDVRAGKPDPETFTRVLAALRGRIPTLSAGECLVIEDSRAGVAAARAAGMHCLAVATSHEPGLLCDADAVVSSLEEVTWARLEEFC